MKLSELLLKYLLEVSYVHKDSVFKVDKKLNSASLSEVEIDVNTICVKQRS